MTTKLSPLKIGIFGLGTVGGGVVELLIDDPRFCFSKVFVADKSKPRSCIPPQSSAGETQRNPFVFVEHPDEILNDSEIECVVELMGGTSIAWDVVSRAIRNGKHVVTANKALISLYINEITGLLNKQPNVCFYYEAAVCGGIPIINVLHRSMAPDRIKRVVGIMNGTTNYILSEMEAKGADFTTTLKKAHELGYAEKDPTADIEGMDTRSKLCILAKLAFGTSVAEAKVRCEGISRIQSCDFDYSRLLNHSIKLLGIAEEVEQQQPVIEDELTAEKGEANGSVVNGVTLEDSRSSSSRSSNKSFIAVSVQPAMVPLGNPLAHVSGAGNAVEIESINLGRSLYVGPGAGRFPTANSVVADLIELFYKRTSPSLTDAFNVSNRAEQHSELVSNYKANFYIRMVIVDQIGVVFKTSELFMKYKIPIFSILQTPIKDKNCVPYVIITEACLISNVERMFDEMESRRNSDFSFLLERPLCLRYFEK